MHGQQNIKKLQFQETIVDLLFLSDCRDFIQPSQFGLIK